MALGAKKSEEGLKKQREKYEVEIQERITGKVLYVHCKTTGKTVLRICRLPNSFEEKGIDIIYGRE